MRDARTFTAIRSFEVFALTGSICLSGCSGELGQERVGGDEGGTGGNRESMETATGGGSTSGAGGAAPGAGGSWGAAGPVAPGSERRLTARVWRLSHEQYEKSVEDLVGVQPDLSGFVPESGNGVYANFSSTALVREDLADNYFDVALEVTEALTTQQLAGLTSCDLSLTCKDAFITELGEKAFRSNVPAEVAARLGSVFDLASGESGPEWGYRAVVVAILNSPLFLYRKEIGPSENATAVDFSLTDSQVAEFLAFSLLGAPPPAWLSEKAKAGLTEPTLPSVIEQLSEEPAFTEQLQHFVTEWLEVHHFDTVEKFEDSFPGFAQAKPLIRQEFDAFLDQSAQPEGGLSGLLLDPVPSVSPALDAFYYSDPSAPPVGTGQRPGVIALGVTMASHAKSYLTSPTLRGTFVRERFFCQEITLPEDFTPPPISDTEALGSARSTRELYENHLTIPSCNRCHQLTDNIGFALEGFDGAGRFRTEDSTQGPAVPLNLETEITDSDVDRPLSGAQDLAQALSESALVKECFARQAFRFYFGQIEPTEEMAAITSGKAHLSEQDSMQHLALGLMATSDTFTRKRETGQ